MHSSELQRSSPIFDQAFMWLWIVYICVVEDSECWDFKMELCSSQLWNQRRTTLRIVGVPFPLVMEDSGQMYTYQGGEIFTACTKYVYDSSWTLKLGVNRGELNLVGMSYATSSLFIWFTCYYIFLLEYFFLRGCGYKCLSVVEFYHDTFSFDVVHCFHV